MVFQADLRIADMFMNQDIHDPVYSPFLKQKNNPDKALDKILEMQYLTAQLTPHARVRGDVAEMVGEIMAIQIGMNYT